MKLSNKQKEEMELVLELTMSEYEKIVCEICVRNPSWTDKDRLTYVKFESQLGTSAYARVKLIE